MAWITKNSGTMTVERRETPYLDDELKHEVETTYAHRYPTRQAMTLPLLHAIQHRYGYLPAQAMQEAAAFLELDPAVVYDTASFYEEFFLEPVGKYVIWICQSISCELMGHMAILDKLQDKLGVEPGETTDDGRFTLMTVECIGACGAAPVALVNHKLHENLSVENIDAVIDALE
jgi:NADH-quinone oxidoreductase subunit E